MAKRSTVLYGFIAIILSSMVIPIESFSIEPNEFVVDAYARKSNIKLNSAYYSLFKKSFLTFLKENKIPRTKVKDSPVTRHIRGNNLLPLPKEGALRKFYKEMSKERIRRGKERISKKKSKSKISKERPREAPSFLKQATPVSLPICKKGETRREKSKFSSNRVKGDKFFDLLYLAKPIPLVGIVSLDFQEFFGEGIIVKLYTSNPGDLVSLQAKQYGVSCLPFRIRVTGDWIYYDSGINALKNYNGHSDRGELHPQIREIRRELLL